MKRMMAVLLILSMAACVTAPNGERHVDFVKVGKYAAGAWVLVKEYRATRNEREHAEEAAQAATFHDRIKLGRVAVYAAQFRETHPDTAPLEAAESAAVWYQLNYGEPIDALIQRLYGPSAASGPSDLDIVLRMVEERVEGTQGTP